MVTMAVGCCCSVASSICCSSRWRWRVVRSEERVATLGGRLGCCGCCGSGRLDGLLLLTSEECHCGVELKR